jgi:hypothetical protein
MDQWKKGKRKGNVVPMIRSYLYLFFESYACHTTKRDTTETSKVIGVLKPLEKYFTLRFVCLVGYIRPS